MTAKERLIAKPGPALFPVEEIDDGEVGKADGLPSFYPSSSPAGSQRRP